MEAAQQRRAEVTEAPREHAAIRKLQRSVLAGISVKL
jgi:hypothetical protein